VERRLVDFVAMSVTVDATGDNAVQRRSAATQRSDQGPLRAWDDGGMQSVLPYVLALVPTVGVAWLFYVIIKNILEGDRRERIAQAKWEAQRDAEERARRGDSTNS